MIVQIRNLQMSFLLESVLLRILVLFVHEVMVLSVDYIALRFLDFFGSLLWLCAAVFIQQAASQLHSCSMYSVLFFLLKSFVSSCRFFVVCSIFGGTFDLALKNTKVLTLDIRE